MTQQDWNYFTTGGVRKHTISDAVDAAEMGRRDLTPHGLAALCLHGQAYGFTSDDVARLEGEIGLAEESDATF